jgi:hypothetical protein
LNKGLVAFFSIAALSIAIAAFPAAKNYRAFASEAADESKAVVIIADYLDIEDIGKMENLYRLTGDSRVALMNNRQPGKAGAGKSKLIIGSGKKLEFSPDQASGGGSESHLKLYSMASRRKPPPGSLVYTDIFKIKNKNANSEYQRYIGYIGDVINKKGGTACYIGNADTERQNRSSMLIATDSSGIVGSGETESVNKEDDIFPCGKRTDYKRLAELYKQYLPASSFIVIETGDMERLEAFKGSMPEEAFETYRQEVLESIDEFVRKIVSHGGFNTLIFLSTYPSESNAEAGNRLTPVVVYEGRGGLLYSKNTRRSGIILNTDIADYLLFKLGYLPECDICELDKEDPVSILRVMNKNILRTSVLRAPVLTYYAVSVILALGMLFALAAFFRKKAGQIWLSLGTVIAYTMLLLPASFLYVSASCAEWGPAEYTVLSTAASFLLSAFLHMVLKDRIKIILSICLILQIGLVADIIMGSELIKRSVLGYDPIIGARFYGIGNEYAGMFIGCSIMVFGCILELMGKRCSRTAAAVYFSICTFLLGLTFLGANFGGASAGALGYLLAYFLIFGIKFSRRNVFAGFLVLVSAAAALIITDSLGLSSQSHMGGLVKDTLANGFGVVISTIKRKVSMNLRLMRYTIWTKVLLCIIAAISIMFYKPVKQMFYIFMKYKYLKYSWVSVSASAAAGFAVNDSGIVTAATSMIFAAFTILIMCIGERKEV